MYDFASALNQLSTESFGSVDEVLGLVEELNEEGLSFDLGEDGQPIQLIDLASALEL